MNFLGPVALYMLKLPQHHIRQLDVGMVVPELLFHGFAIDFHREMRTEMHAGEARGATVADLCRCGRRRCVITDHHDVVLRANFGAGAAPHALFGIHVRAGHLLGLGGNGRTAEQPAEGVEPVEVQTALLGGHILYDLLQPRAVPLELLRRFYRLLKSLTCQDFYHTGHNKWFV